MSELLLFSLPLQLLAATVNLSSRGRGEAARQSRWTRSHDKAVEEAATVLLGKVAAGHNLRRVPATAQRVAAVTPRVRVAASPNETRPGRLLTLGRTNRIKRLILHLG